MSKYADKQFWIDTTDRAVATFAQAAVGALTAGATGLFDIDLLQIGSVAGLAALVSVLTSVAFRGRGEEAIEFEDTPEEDDGTTPEDVEYLEEEPVVARHAEE